MEAPATKRRPAGSAIAPLLLAGLAACCATAGAEPVTGDAGPLAGRTFDVRLVEEGKEEGDADKLVFTKTTFESEICRPYGFKPAPVSVELKGGVIEFRATATSPTDGTTSWKGSGRGDAIEGTMTWTKEGQSVRYTFKGTASG